MEGQQQQQHGGNLHHTMEGEWQQHVGDNLDHAIGSDNSSMDLPWGHSHGGGGDLVMDDLLGAAAASNMMSNIDNSTDGATAGAAEEEEVNGGGVSQESGRTAGVKRKRHSREQIQQLQDVFREVPRPDEKLRKVLSKKVGLTSRQVKFWFQNRRSSNKKQACREENKVIRGENEMLRAENQAIRAAIIQKTCRTCGGATVPIQETPEQRRLRLHNARLKEELMRASAILNMLTRKEPAVVWPDGHGGLPVGLPVGLSKAVFGGTAGMPFLPPRALADPMLFAPEECVSDSHCAARDNSGRAALQRHVQHAMEEFRSLVSKGKPIWLPTQDGEVLNYEEYSKATFPSILGQIPMGFAVDGTRESGMVMGIADDLAGIFTNADRWSEMFPGIVEGTIARKLSIPSASLHGQIQLMKAELRVPAPQVPVHKVKFIRQCEMLDPGVWAVVDVSVDGVSIPEADDSSTAELHEQNCDTPAKYTPCRLMPSGCLIEDMKNGFSKVTWIVIIEYDKTTVPPLYHPLLRSGHGLGARRWLASLKRQCEYIAVLHSDPARTLSNTGGIPPKGMNNVLQLAQRMMASFYAGMSRLGGQTWRRLDEWHGDHGLGSERVKLTVYFMTSSLTGPGEQQDPSSLVVTATTTMWLPGKPSHAVFDYLCDGERRGEWDTLANGEPMQEEHYVATCQLHGNAISVLRPNESDGTGNNKMILQETRVDQSCMLLAYAPISEQSMMKVMNERSNASAFLQPSGFVILPDGHCSEPLVPHSAAQRTANTLTCSQNNAGSVVSAVSQTLLSGPPPERITTETIDHIGKMLCHAMKKIKDAVRAKIAVAT